MSNLRKAAEMALEAWEKPFGERAQAVEDAIEALRQALAQPEQKPVAWEYFYTPDSPFYTAPPKREWVGLTDEEVSKILDREIGFNSCWGPETDFARAIEAKLKEKNGG